MLMKPIIKLPILLLLLLSTLLLTCACKPGDPAVTPADTSGESTTDTGAQEEDEYPFLVEKFGTEESPVPFVIAGRNERSDYLVCEYDSDIMHRATFERNALLEELYGISIELLELGHSDGTTFLPALEAEYYAGSGDYDLICPAWWWGTDLKGYYVNLLNYDNVIDLDDPWWFDGWNDNVTFAGYMSSIMGEAQFDTYYNMEVLYFNAETAEAVGLDPYQHVDDMTWTIEVVDQYGKMASSDLDGNGIDMAQGDKFGSLINSESSIYTALYSLGVKYAKNVDGEITLHHKDEANYKVFDRMFDFINEQDHNVLVNTSTLGAEATEPFTAGQSLFCWQAFRVGSTIYQSGLKFGIVPCPMLNEEQGEYVTAIYDATNFSIMSTSKNKHMSVTVLNAMNALTDEFMTGLYFDEVLGLRIAGNEDSSRMIPLIRDSLYCDYAWINTGHMDYCASKYGSYIATGRDNIASLVDQEFHLWEQALVDIRAKMVEYRDRDAA